MVRDPNSAFVHTVPIHRPAYAAQEVARQLQERGVKLDKLLKDMPHLHTLLQAGVPLLSFRETASFFEQAAAITKNPNFGFDMGMRRDFRSMGLVAYSAISAPDLEGFLTSFCDKFTCYSDTVDVQFSTKGKLKWTVHEPAVFPHRHYVEFLATLLFKSARMFLEPRSGTQTLVAKAVWLDADAGASLRQRDVFWGCPIDNSADHYEIHFNPSDLSRNMRSSDPYLHKLVEGFGLQQQMQTRELQRSLRCRVQEIILRDISHRKVTQDTVSNELGLSTRTFARELNRSNLSFFSILDDLRRDLARTYLRDSELSPSMISVELGYASVSSFNDAFRRWTSMTPTQFRQTVKNALGMT